MGILNKLAKILGFFSEYAQDLWIFLRHNNHSPLEPAERRLSNKTIIEAHTIEKGLTLPKPKPHFGRDKINALLNMNAGWAPAEGDLSRSMLVGALRDYQVEFQDKPSPDPEFSGRISSFVESHDANEASGGVRTAPLRVNMRNEAAIEFLENRFSAREFGDTPISDSDLAAITQLTQRAPSQCNRQSCRLHVYRDRQKIQELLELQGGSRGFSDAVPTLFVVTSEVTAWGGPQQRNQPYMDGGLFSMMLLLGLDATGFVSCPLNLAITNRTERAIKAAGNIPARERLIVMVAAGQQPAHAIRAANSPRWGADMICQVHS